MGSRIVWRKGDFVNIRLRDDLYTIGQMLTSPVMRFYNVFNNNGVWSDINLNNVDVLFRVFIDRGVNTQLVTGEIKVGAIVPCDIPDDPYWIKPYTLTMDAGHYMGDRYSFPFLGGKIIHLDVNGGIGTTLAPVVKDDLVLPEDRELIEKYELTNMWGADSLSARLCRFYDSGINRDDLKFEVFPGLWSDRDELRPLTCRLPVPFR
ncbi:MULTISPECIES: hypothetical protein [Lelliottia]|uniref:Uncharacterized protein n=1 Tax=Lelliottia aquatilis TaxID=2080838 RepID=A0ABX5A6D0_9ENTR|nr:MULTISPECIES: hypothetical protein [Lelliottia]POZ20641.1 hypothetical protein C3711_22140 [Lelliottia aquatilis]POZ26007.1 hypothetical protein C3712_04605 [Lelliottia aquatilis]POZ29164.1 hypothetical protein C3708_04610 [Lelliottia sp. 7254-16]POZ33469.1 hypothetical protein C3710_08600 [Lelliottia aquatilis]POZ39790.1 hypothetical protein C3709_04605 [Lelliottia aquatilis]